MNPIRTIRRLATTLTGLAAALAAAVAAAPAAFAATRVHPAPVPPAELVRFGPAAYTFNGVTAGMTDWQIALIAVAAAIVRCRLGPGPASGPGPGSPRSPGRDGRLSLWAEAASSSVAWPRGGKPPPRGHATEVLTGQRRPAHLPQPG